MVVCFIAFGWIHLSTPLVILFFFFFFLAADGIRDYKVTGVQTCALPIWIVAELAARYEGTTPVPADAELLAQYFTFTDFRHFIEVYLTVVDLIRDAEDVRMLTYEIARSEERRVGQETGERWGAAQSVEHT